MAGVLVGVVGPSGVGKDSVMEALAAARPDLHLVRRVITRPEAAGGERFEAVSEAEVARRRAAGEFVLHWPAHGLHYGVPTSVRARLEAGQSCVVNLSRAMLAEAGRRFERFVTLHLSAPAPVLAARLAARGRESEQEVARRLSRADHGLPPGLGHVIEIANDGPLAATVARVLAALHSERV